MERCLGFCFSRISWLDNSGTDSQRDPVFHRQRHPCVSTGPTATSGISGSLAAVYHGCLVRFGLSFCPPSLFVTGTDFLAKEKLVFTLFFNLPPTYSLLLLLVFMFCSPAPGTYQNGAYWATRMYFYYILLIVGVLEAAVILTLR